MIWWVWFIIGIVAGIVFTVGAIIGGTQVIMHSDKLSQYFIGRTTRAMAHRMMKP